MAPPVPPTRIESLNTFVGVLADSDDRRSSAFSIAVVVLADPLKIIAAAVFGEWDGGAIVLSFVTSHPADHARHGTITGSLLLARLGCNKLIAADLVERIEIVVNERPHDLGCDAFVVMAKYIADSGHVAPRDFRMARLEIVRQMAARFGDDLDATLNQPLPAPVFLKRIERNACHLAANTLDGLDDVGQAWDRRCIVH